MRSDAARRRLMSQLVGKQGKEAWEWRAHGYLSECQRGRDGQIGRRKQEVKVALF